MHEFPEQALYDHGVTCKQLQLIKAFLNHTTRIGEICFDRVEFQKQPFETQAKYIKVILTSDFEKHHNAGYLFDLIEPTLEGSLKPFAQGVITYGTYGNRKHITLDYTIHETAPDAMKHKRKYLLEQIKPHLAFFYSINEIGDTVIEVHNKS